ncbi:hypothetical protein L228DRAFT_259765 [Xylona heveae TC161]|uniref:VanZ-like domain-containing protein n=1 Tax=Xylona heveae (strain CBS 132557 / TC161) TaxID=1328760 RepID=A0A165I920_XYLHT|nr:hypothetical protein L228DRAFT_259765 [Xylona heveae TC161]KZF24562.1 hypothetical protein L228DRAFT_259765 [Xylona heveae TC161]
MRVRPPFAGGFCVLLLGAAYLGLSSIQIKVINDKILHLVTFFILSLCFYWVLETTRRRAMNFTLIVCTGILGVGSEFIQAVIPNGRQFDPYDILANLVGSLIAVALCSWYHKGMLERRRRTRQYQAVSGQEEEPDVELGGLEPQETGVTRDEPQERTVEEELDNWDENAEDNWEDDEPSAQPEGSKATGQKASGGEGAVDEAGKGKKRDD